MSFDGRDDRLLILVERIERISAEIAGLQEDRKDIYAEAKAIGYCPATLRMVVARRAVAPDDRAEADTMLAVYEAAMRGDAPDPAIDPGEAARELAIAILAEQAEGIRDPAQANLLAEHVAVLLDIRAEIAQLREAESQRKAIAVADGFERNPLTALVRWIEKCAKHGPDAMRAAEAVFQMYRGTIEGSGVAPPLTVSKDPKLQPLASGKRAPVSKLAWHDAGGV